MAGFVLGASLSLVGLLAPSGPAAGQHAGAFARMGFGARGMAMGNALAADRVGDASSYYNPALAAYGRREAEAGFALLAADRELQFLSFRTPLPPRAGIGVGLIHAGVGQIDGRDASGYHTRTYTSDQYAGLVDFALRFGDRVGAGVGLRIYRSSLGVDVPASNTLGLRAGLLVRATPRLTLGAAASDLLAGYEWDSSSLYGQSGTRVSDPFPVRVRTAGAYRLLEDALQIHLEYRLLVVRAERPVERTVVVGGAARTGVRLEEVSDLSGSWRLGAEWRAASSFYVRAGLSGIRASAPRPIEPSAGFLVRQTVAGKPLRVAYAAVLEPYVVRPVHVVSLRVEL